MALATSSEWPSCGVCGYWDLSGLSWIPIVGPSIWATVFLEQGNYLGVLGLIGSATQLVGVAMLIAGGALHHQPRSARSTLTVSISPAGASLAFAF